MGWRQQGRGLWWVGVNTSMYEGTEKGTLEESGNYGAGVGTGERTDYSLPRYWAVQAGLLTPLTFAWHRLNPLAAFNSGAYFIHNGRQ